MRIRPINAHLVRPHHAAWVVVPSFDALTWEQAENIRRQNPRSFLHAMHAPGDDFTAALDRSAAGLADLLAREVFGELIRDCLFVYRMSSPGGEQTGVVCGIRAAEFAEGGSVLPHEAVQPELVAYLARYMEVLGATSSPVKATFRATGHIESLLRQHTSTPPAVSVGNGDDVLQEVWPIENGHAVGELVEAFGSVGRAYITDGHHRSAATLQMSPDAPVLTVLFPDDHLRITQFNRVVTPIEDSGALMRFLEREGRRTGEPPHQVEPGHVGIHVQADWHLAALPRVDAEPPESLDPTVLQEVILGPLLGVVDPGSDPRLHFVPGSVPLDELERRAQHGAAFVLAPVSVADVMAVADRGRSMPPKSTYFEPKARSGIFLMRY